MRTRKTLPRANPYRIFCTRDVEPNEPLKGKKGLHLYRRDRRNANNDYKSIM